MILIIDKTQKRANSAKEVFYYMGFMSGAVTPEHALSEISNRYKAVLIFDAESIRAEDEFIKTLRAYSLGAPIFAVANRVFDTGHLYDAVFPNSLSFSDILFGVLSYIKERNLAPIGNYRLRGLDASVYPGGVHYFGKPIKFTRTEAMIVRYLILSYPVYARSEDILKYAFKDSRRPEIANVRTHISVINKKFKELTGEPLIASEARVGYKLTAPEEKTVH